MKTKIKELDGDFIGGQDSMTKEEEQVISDFIKGWKLLTAKKMFEKLKHHNRKR